MTRSVYTIEYGTVEEQVGWDVSVEIEPETILNGATVNNSEFVLRVWANHGFFNTNYVFLLAGNKLLDMGTGGILDGSV